VNETPTIEEAPKLPFPLQDGEQVLQLVRRHWLYLWPTLFVILLIAFVPLAVIAFALSAAGAYEGTVANIFWILAAAYALVAFVRIFLTWYRYQHDVWVITNQRIIDSYKRHPFNLRLSTADLVSLQDMTVDRSGVLQTVFDYGDILCQTAAAGDLQQDFHLVGIPHPRDVQALIDRERDRERLRVRGAF
jgi:hypothetical protein